MDTKSLPPCTCAYRGTGGELHAKGCKRGEALLRLSLALFPDDPILQRRAAARGVR